MEQICEAVIGRLAAAGLEAQSALPFAAACRVRKPVSSVQMTRWALEGRPVYLGLMEELELFGHRLEGTLELLVHAPKAAEAAAAAVQAASVLVDGIEGVTLRQVETGAVRYERELDHFVCPVTATVDAWLYAVPRDDGLYFEDFVLRGDLRSAWKEQEDEI